MRHIKEDAELSARFGGEPEAVSVEMTKELDGTMFSGSVDGFRYPNGITIVPDSEVAEFDARVAEQAVRHGLIGPETFRFLRKKAGLPIQEMALLLGMDRKTISRWENGQVSVPRTAMVALYALVAGHLHGEVDARRWLTTMGEYEDMVRAGVERKIIVSAA